MISILSMLIGIDVCRSPKNLVQPSNTQVSRIHASNSFQGGGGGGPVAQAPSTSCSRSRLHGVVHNMVMSSGGRGPSASAMTALLAGGLLVLNDNAALSVSRPERTPCSSLVRSGFQRPIGARKDARPFETTTRMPVRRSNTCG